MLVGHMLIVICTPIRASVLGLSKTEGALLLSVFGIVACVYFSFYLTINKSHYLYKHVLVNSSMRYIHKKKCDSG